MKASEIAKVALILIIAAPALLGLIDAWWWILFGHNLTGNEWTAARFYATLAWTFAWFFILGASA